MGVADDAERDLQIQLARLEHGTGRVTEQGEDPDAVVATAEGLAETAAQAAAAFDRLVREAGVTR